jgi:hypothetical protein
MRREGGLPVVASGNLNFSAANSAAIISLEIYRLAAYSYHNNFCVIRTPAQQYTL